MFPVLLSKISDTCALSDMTSEAETWAFAEHMDAQFEAGQDAEQGARPGSLW